ncbi:isochorismatase family protein [bacterium]|nr:isochorismatase family protein [bacterium]
MIINQDNCLFLIIDIQEKLLNAVFNKESLEKKASILSKAANLLNIPLLVTEQYPKGLGETIENLKYNAQIFVKDDFNALNNDDLLKAIKESNRNQIIVLGIETHICVHQTVAALLAENYNITVVSDACGSRAENEYLSALDVMKTNGASIKTTEMILFELLKTSKHEHFKAVQALIK